MINYIVYNSDGDILRTGIAPESQVSLQAGDGEFTMHGVADDSKHKIEGGVIVDKVVVSTTDEVLELLRIQRDQSLTNSDWTQVADAPVDQAAWRAYRQALRDLPSQYQNETDFANVVFPNPPE